MNECIVNKTAECMLNLYLLSVLMKVAFIVAYRKPRKERVEQIMPHQLIDINKCCWLSLTEPRIFLVA